MFLPLRSALFAVLVSLACSCPGAETAATLPPAVKRVLFLGDSITYGGFYAACVETYFVTRHPAREIEFINAGLSSETVSGLSEPGHAGGAFPRPDLHERLARVLAQTKPDLVFACYGMNDGIYLPLDDTRFAAYQSGLRRLRAAVTAAGATLVHLTPPVYVDVKGQSPTYPAVLDRYAEWLVQQRSAGWEVIDVHTAMARALAARRQSEPAFTFSRDGVHPDEAGHWVMARAVLAHLGARDFPAEGDLAAMLAAQPRGAEILKLVRSRSEILRDAWLTSTGHTRPKTKAGLPLAEANELARATGEKIRALLAAP